MLPPAMYGGRKWRAVGIVEEIARDGLDDAWGSFFTCTLTRATSYWASLVQNTCALAVDDMESLEPHDHGNCELPASFCYFPVLHRPRKRSRMRLALFGMVGAAVLHALRCNTARNE